ncbi:RNA pseudouridylate synthase domain-containing protein 2 [Eufriesea mexicana]|uniref:RNA pseudouridylate synthase domain-containing protein 2 n=1 Tax=Eufriesea mexicana TaxID=516756 RepID=A0A310SQB1_9HYME|nr:RNA pseudouridylate synthase domain-containing protein 2 [Eufriesea mexicana]
MSASPPTTLEPMRDKGGRGEDEWLRKVYPYYFTFTTFTKGRWVGEKILEVFAREFRAHPAEEYERCIRAGTLTVNYQKVDVDYRLRHNDLLANVVHRRDTGKKPLDWLENCAEINCSPAEFIYPPPDDKSFLSPVPPADLCGQMHPDLSFREFKTPLRRPGCRTPLGVARQSRELWGFGAATRPTTSRLTLPQVAGPAAKFSNKFTVTGGGYARYRSSPPSHPPPSSHGEAPMDACISWQPPSPNIVTDPTSISATSPVSCLTFRAHSFGVVVVAALMALSFALDLVFAITRPASHHTLPFSESYSPTSIERGPNLDQASPESPWTWSRLETAYSKRGPLYVDESKPAKEPRRRYEHPESVRNSPKPLIISSSLPISPIKAIDYSPGYRPRFVLSRIIILLCRVFNCPSRGIF